jgi:hypothetical protein
MLSKEEKAAIARRNGAKSKGPKTQEGKAISSKNALRHGLTSRKIVIEGLESEAEFNRFRTGIRSHYQPQDLMEAVWVDRITSCLWRLRRVTFEEAQMIAEGNDSPLGNRDRFLPPNFERLELLSTYEERIMRQLQLAIREFEKLRAAQPKNIPSPLPSISVRCSDIRD